ncbi:hypothetical protein AT959_11140 [Dechloromonas denitrificans]|uniref:Hemerythrin-like domain-containing protein n=1 Tax=Dechloromonas denitrificans TaxID=281362 RepID=A0A133XG70_9RHOO|nr:hemerythrin family protein [Dechloromonas denitrificans]KXB29948.1 hypothetical protein AT959_11140 [Dechloromonas denitrificans]
MKNSNDACQLALRRKALDKSHDELAELLLKLRDPEDGNMSIPTIANNFCLLIELATRHFQEQERYLARIDFPDTLHHQELHDQILSNAANMCASLLSGELGEIEMLRRRAVKIFEDHLRTEDRKIADFTAPGSTRKN